MTLVFQGHIEKVERAGLAQIAVSVYADQRVCPDGIVLMIPEKDVAHWLVGRCVSITAYAFEPRVAAAEQTDPQA